VKVLLLENLKEKLTVLKLVRNTKKGFEKQLVVTTKGSEKEALKKAQKRQRIPWILVVKSNRKCPKCGENLEDWGIYNTTEGLIRLFKCEKCNYAETEKATIKELLQMVKNRT